MSAERYWCGIASSVRGCVVCNADVGGEVVVALVDPTCKYHQGSAGWPQQGPAESFVVTVLLREPKALFYRACRGVLRTCGFGGASRPVAGGVSGCSVFANE